MAKNKTLLEEALQEAEVFRSIMAENAASNLIKEELDDAINEVADEDETEFDEEDLDDSLDNDENTDVEMDADADMDAEDNVEFDAEDETSDVDADDEEIDFEDDSETEDSLDGDVEGDFDVTDGEEDVVLDMTDAPDDDVIQVFKKMSDNDEIEIVDDTVKITDPESGNEYKVEMGGEEGPIEGDDFLSEAFDFGLDGLEDLNFHDEEQPEELTEDMLDDVIKRRNGHYVHALEVNDVYELQSAIEGIIDSEPDRDPEDLANFIKTLDVYYLGEDPQEEERVHNFNVDAYVDEILGTSEYDAFENNEEPLFEIELEEEEEVLDEQIPVGLAQAKRTSATNAIKSDILGAGAQAQLKEENAKLKAINAKLIAEAKELVSENKKQRNALKVIKQRIEETKVYTYNMSTISKIMMEHSTTKAEKQTIFERFKNVKSINEAQALEVTIGKELISRGTIAESVQNKINTNINSSSSVLNESKTYSPEIERMRGMM